MSAKYVKNNVKEQRTSRTAPCTTTEAWGTLYPHQQSFLEKNPDSALLAWEAGTGKTHVAKLWLATRTPERALVVCPKSIKKKWQQDFAGTVLTKEEFVKEYKAQRLPESVSAVVIDEADEFAAPLFTQGRSQRAEAMYQTLKKWRNTPTLLLTATPIRSNPANLHTLLCYMHKYYDWHKWQKYFYRLERRPYLPRPAWMPKKNWRTQIRAVLERHAHVALIRDVVKEVPEEYIEVVQTPSKEYESKESEPSAQFVDEHRHEQEGKAPAIRKLAKQFRKVFVVVHYREQIAKLEKELGKERQVYVIHGGVKDHEEVLEQAQQDDECYLIVQASIAAGFDADSFSCMVFASMSYKVRDYVQMKARVRRVHNLHDVWYYYCIGGPRDQAIYDTVQAGTDFVPSEYLARVAKAEEA